MLSDMDKNLGSMGHRGNTEDGGGSGLSVYGVFHGPISNTVNQLLNDSYVIKIVTLGLDSLFPAAASSPIFGTAFESLGILKYADIGNLVTGFHVPLSTIFPSGKNKSNNRGNKVNR